MIYNDWAGLPPGLVEQIARARMIEQSRALLTTGGLPESAIMDAAAAEIIGSGLALNDMQAFNVKSKAFAGGAKGDGNANDAAPVQAAINAAGIGGRVFFPPGKYYFGGTTLTGLMFQRWEGTFQFGTGGVPGNDGRAVLVWDATLGANNGVVAGVNQMFSRLMFQGAGKLVTTGWAVSQGTSIQSNHSKYEYCQFYDWGRGLTLTNAFYSTFNVCEWARCAIGVVADTCYNLHFDNCAFRCFDNVITNTGGVAIDAINQIRHLKVQGGSIEGFSGSGGLILTGGGSLLDVFGVYFESSVVGTNGIGIDNRVDGNTVVAIGNLVYLTELNRWLNCSGRDKTTLIGHGNHFVCPNTSVATPMGYFLPNNGTSGSIDLGPDNWTDVALAGALYISSINAPIANSCRVIVPKNWSSSNLRDVEVKGRPMWMVAQGAPPAGPITGTIAHADKTNWNPCGFNANDPYVVFWDGSRWNPMARPSFFGSKTYDPPSLAAGSWTTALTTISVPNAAIGDKVHIAFSLDTQGIQLFGRVTSSGTVTVDAWNPTGGAIDLASGTISAFATRY